MEWKEVKQGMVFDQYTMPRFLFVRSKDNTKAELIGIDKAVKSGDPEWHNINTEFEWEDYFYDAELVTNNMVKRQVIKELLGEI